MNINKSTFLVLLLAALVCSCSTTKDVACDTDTGMDTDDVEASLEICPPASLLSGDGEVLTASENDKYRESAFSARSASSNFGNVILYRSDRLLVFSGMKDFFWNRETELKLYRMLREKGFSDIELLTDSADINSFGGEGDDFAVYMYQKCSDGGEGYIIQITFSDVTTYEYGGGIADIRAEIVLKDMYTWEELIKIMVVAEKGKNDQSGFSESLEDAMDVISRQVATELCKYVGTEGFSKSASASEAEKKVDSLVDRYFSGQ